MKKLLTPSYEALSQTACGLVTDALLQNPSLFLCLATGSTPTLTYNLLAEEYTKTPHLFDKVRIIKLDEWGSLPMDDPATCEVYLQKHVIKPLGIAPSRYISFQSNPSNPEAECKRVHETLEQSGPIDVCILGLGGNGHLGFNEPADVLQPFPHMATLAQSTLQHPMTQQTTAPISYGLTLGMANISQSRRILLLVSGQHKGDLLSRLLSGEVSTHFPASFLWLHPDVTVVCDQDAWGVQ